MPSTIFRSLGAGAVLVVVVAVVAMLTLIPAMLSLLGDRDRLAAPTPIQRGAVAPQPRAGSDETIHSGFWGRGGPNRHAPSRHRRRARGRCLLASDRDPVLPAAPGSRLGVETLPQSNIKTAYSILNGSFQRVSWRRIEIVVDARTAPQMQAAIDRLVNEINQNRVLRSEHRGRPGIQAGDLALVKATLKADSNSPLAYDALKQLRDKWFQRRSPEPARTSTSQATRPSMPTSSTWSTQYTP